MPNKRRIKIIKRTFLILIILGLLLNGERVAKDIYVVRNSKEIEERQNRYLISPKDYLKGEIETDMMSSLSESMSPIQSKIERLIMDTDSLMVNLNRIIS